MTNESKRGKRTRAARPAGDAGRPQPQDPYAANLEEQKKLPAGYAPDRKELTLEELVDRVKAGKKVLRFPDLTDEQRRELTIKRVKKFGNLEIAVLGVGIVNQKRALKELDKKPLTPLGRALIEVEGLMIARLEKKLTMWPRRRRKRGPSRRRVGRRRPRSLEARSVEAQPGILCMDSCFDEATSNGRIYRRENVYREFDHGGYRTEQMCSMDAGQGIHARASGGNNIVYLTGIGHGQADRYLASDGSVLFQAGGGYRPQEVAGKIAHFLSCETAMTLGPDFIQNGCRAYFGYNGVFFYPPEREIWPIFLECDSAIDIGFANGLLAQDVLADVNALFQERMEDLESQGLDYAASLLEQDMYGLRMLGDPVASLPLP